MYNIRSRHTCSMAPSGPNMMHFIKQTEKTHLIKFHPHLAPRGCVSSSPGITEHTAYRARRCAHGIIHASHRIDMLAACLISMHTPRIPQKHTHTHIDLLRLNIHDFDTLRHDQRAHYTGFYRDAHAGCMAICPRRICSPAHPLPHYTYYTILMRFFVRGSCCRWTIPSAVQSHTECM